MNAILKHALQKGEQGKPRQAEMRYQIRSIQDVICTGATFVDHKLYKHLL
jgi:hypothetical protein